jgi:hypothetical protein
MKTKVKKDSKAKVNEELKTPVIEKAEDEEVETPTEEVVETPTEETPETEAEPEKEKVEEEEVETPEVEEEEKPAEEEAEEPAEETPVEEPAEETPVEEPAEETPVEEPAEEEAEEEKPAEEEAEPEEEVEKKEEAPVAESFDKAFTEKVEKSISEISEVVDGLVEKTAAIETLTKSVEDLQGIVKSQADIIEKLSQMPLGRKSMATDFQAVEKSMTEVNEVPSNIQALLDSKIGEYMEKGKTPSDAYKLAKEFIASQVAEA